VTTSYRKRAQRGYRFLASDEGKRLGFNVHLLNSDMLELSDACNCALGETFEGGSYWDAAERLADEGYPVITMDDALLSEVSFDVRPTYTWEREHGFILAGGDPSTPQEYTKLTEAWREVIKEERDRDRP